MRRKSLVFALSAVATALVAAPAAHAQDGALDRTPEDCISVSRLRSTRVVDDQTVLFYMRGRDAYRNDLHIACPRLAQEDRFAYETRVGRLCSSDTITVLQSFGGRFERGATCRLGEFHPITHAEADDIVAGPAGAKQENDGVDVEEVELPDEDEGEESGNAGASDESPQE